MSALLHITKHVRLYFQRTMTKIASDVVLSCCILSEAVIGVVPRMFACRPTGSESDRGKGKLISRHKQGTRETLRSRLRLYNTLFNISTCYNEFFSLTENILLQTCGTLPLKVTTYVRELGINIRHHHCKE